MLCLMLSFMYNKQLHGTKNGPNFLSIVSFVVPEMMEIRIGAGLSTIDKTIKAWKLSSWAAQGVLTFYDTSNEFSELETITKIKATSYFKSITFFRLI